MSVCLSVHSRVLSLSLTQESANNVELDYTTSSLDLYCPDPVYQLNVCDLCIIIIGVTKGGFPVVNNQPKSGHLSTITFVHTFRPLKSEHLTIP